MRGLDPAQFGGLRPAAWICVGPGFSREEIKTELLARGVGLTRDSVQDLTQIAVRILVATGRVASGFERLLGPHSRQEGLRMLMAEPRISSRMPELRRLKRQRTFYKKLDKALQAGRKVAAHEEEEAVFEQRLMERLGSSPIRQEVRRLAAAYGAWCEGLDLWDEPAVLLQAVESLRRGIPEGMTFPQEIWRITTQKPEGLELEFWERLSAVVVIRDYDFAAGVARATPGGSGETIESAPPSTLDWSWDRWHTLDDAADALAETLAAETDWSGDAVLMPDTPAIRRTLKRALGDRGVPLADPRDPTRLRWDEGIKAALLPLEVVARGFEREKVVAWLKPKNPKWVQEIYSRGIRNRLASYAGGSLEVVHSRLLELEKEIGGRRTAEEMAEAHLKLLRIQAGADASRDWLVEFFEELWTELKTDLERVGQGRRRAPLLFWFERLQARLEDATPPADQTRPSRGVALYRLAQAPLRPVRRVWLLGLPPDWLNGEGAGDYWYSDAEREVLATEFAVRSSHQVREERLSILKAWVASASEVKVLDASYDWDGRERPSLLPVLRELGLPEAQEALDRGAHSRWISSFGPVPTVAPLRIKLPLDPSRVKVAGGKPEIRATELDRFSRCAFLALGGSRWKLYDLRAPEADLWPDMKGNVLHAAVRILVESRDESGGFSRAIAEALDQAWEEERPRGLLRGQRLESYSRKKLLPVLEKFALKEKEYVARSGTKVLGLEGPELRLEFDRFTLIGRPDRIDENSEGVFVLDYKTSAALPNGRMMVEQGLRLQLPFYALAARQLFGKPALGVQFVELSRRANRSAGIFFKRYNGKEPGKLTATTANSKSLLDDEPDEAWAKIEEHVISHAQDYLDGRFIALPKDPKECARCTLSDLCGWRRRSASGNAGSGEESEGGGG